MNRQLHNSDEVFISAQQGWEQMQLLLDKKLPVKKKRLAIKIYLPIMVRASLIMSFLISTLVLNNTAIINSFNKDLTIGGVSKPVSDKINGYQGKVIAASKNVTNRTIRGHKLGRKEMDIAAGLSADSNNLVFKKIVPPKIIQEIAEPPIENLSEENVIAKTAVIAIPDVAKGKDLTGVSENTGKSHQKHNWSLAAGLAMNTMIGHQQNLRLFPAAELQYNISNRFFLSVGVSAASHVATKNRGVMKTVYVNDMVNNIQFYNTVNHYYDLAYADIPLLAGVNINKNLAIQAGLQSSVLLKAKSETLIEQYDYQMRMASVRSSWSPAGTAAPVSEINYRVDARKMDYRFTSGIRYRFNKLAVNLMYQHSLQPVIKGDLTSRDRNQLVTLTMQFKIR